VKLVAVMVAAVIATAAMLAIDVVMVVRGYQRGHFYE
jgi:hypothetical protein